jgi:excisionase family DNA binding protein
VREIVMTKNLTLASTDILLTPAEAAAFMKVSLSFLAKARHAGTGPVYRKIGRAVRYLRSDLDTYLAARVRISTSQS